jgi:hypothetical protein
MNNDEIHKLLTQWWRAKKTESIEEVIDIGNKVIGKCVESLPCYKAYDPNEIEKDSKQSKKEKEMIKFITKENPEILTFEDVELNQFFVSRYGHLCQKCSLTDFNVIANFQYQAFAGRVDSYSADEKVLKIFPKIEKIEF